MRVPVKSYSVKGGINDVSLDVCPRMRKKVVFPSHFSFDYKVLFLHNEGKTVSSLNGTGKLVDHILKNESRTFFNTIHKIKLKMD